MLENARIIRTFLLRFAIWRKIRREVGIILPFLNIFRPSVLDLRDRSRYDSSHQIYIYQRVLSWHMLQCQKCVAAEKPSHSIWITQMIIIGRQIRTQLQDVDLAPFAIALWYIYTYIAVAANIDNNFSQCIGDGKRCTQKIAYFCSQGRTIWDIVWFIVVNILQRNLNCHRNNMDIHLHFTCFNDIYIYFKLYVQCFI